VKFAEGDVNPTTSVPDIKRKRSKQESESKPLTIDDDYFRFVNK
jgi:hypothetical protein